MTLDLTKEPFTCFKAFGFHFEWDTQGKEYFSRNENEKIALTDNKFTCSNGKFSKVVDTGMEALRWFIEKEIEEQKKEVTPQNMSVSLKEQFATALILLKDFKTDFNKPMDLELMIMIIGMANMIGVKTEFEKLLSKIPPMSIKPREY